MLTSQKKAPHTAKLWGRNGVKIQSSSSMILTTDASPTFWHTTTRSRDLITPADFPWSSATFSTDSFVGFECSACKNNKMTYMIATQSSPLYGVVVQDMNLQCWGSYHSNFLFPGVQSSKVVKVRHVQSYKPTNTMILESQSQTYKHISAMHESNCPKV